MAADQWCTSAKCKHAHSFRRENWRSAHPPVWQARKVHHPWALFHNTTVVLFELIITGMLRFSVCVSASNRKSAEQWVGLDLWRAQSLYLNSIRTYGGPEGPNYLQRTKYEGHLWSTINKAQSTMHNRQSTIHKVRRSIRDLQLTIHNTQSICFQPAPNPT